MKKAFFILPLLSSLVSNAQTARELENITAFSKLYGYVKYFHPSDEAAAMRAVVFEYFHTCPCDPLHGVGLLPDVYVKKTIQGVRENRDEFLERALEVATAAVPEPGLKD